MNHGCFIDILIASKLLKFTSYSTMTMHEAFIGRRKLLTKLGCFPTHKFIYSPLTVLNSIKLINELKQSILLFPEGAYSFDGTSSPISPNISKYIKCLKCNVLFIKTRGSYLSQPLYNHLKKRKVPLSASIECLLTKEQVNTLNDVEINKIINDRFKTINYYQEQLEDNVLIKNKDCADYLESVLYKCPHCLKEGEMVARGTTIKCKQCGEEYNLNEDGSLSNKNNKTMFKSIPDWYKWERECVREEIINNKYHEEFNCLIYAVKNFDFLYAIKELGVVIHDINNEIDLKVGNNTINKFNLNNMYSINSDLYFYSLGDVVSVGNQSIKYFLVPKDKFSGIVTKIRLRLKRSIN